METIENGARTGQHATAAVTRAAPVQPAARPFGRRAFAIELASRVFAACALSLFAYAAYMQWRADPTRITLIVTAFASCLTVGLSLFARVPRQRDWSVASLVLSLGGTYYFLLFQLTFTQHIIPDPVAAPIQIVGVLWQIYAKLSLSGSFGILPANRGIVSRGAYRFIRHPIYLGYLIVDIGFLLANFSTRNFIAITLQMLLQAGRILREERLLAEDPDYRAYCGKVRYRVIPGLF